MYKNIILNIINYNIYYIKNKIYYNYFKKIIKLSFMCIHEVKR